MLHEFFKNDIQKDFILMLLKSTPLPISRCVFDNDRIVKGITYIYNLNIIKCTLSGCINNPDNLALFDIIKAYSKDLDKNINYLPTCSCAYYDSETHEALGDYLRYYRMMYDINLMLLYNCFSYNLILGFSIVPTSSDLQAVPYIKNDSLENVKLLIIPIKFNKLYSLSLDCTTGVTILPCLYSNRGFLTDYSELGTKLYIGKKYSTIFKPFNISSLSILTPTTFSIKTDSLSEKDEYDLNELEKYLKIIILLPKNNESSVVLLEGNYTNNRKNTVIEFIPDIPLDYSSTTLDRMLRSKPALLLMSDGNQYAYSDKLIEYLLDNVITLNETITGNIEMVQLLIAENLSKQLPYLYIDADGILKQQGGNMISTFSLSSENSNLVPTLLSYLNKGIFDVEYNKLKDTDVNVTVKDYLVNYVGFYKDIWSDKLRFILYNMYMNNSKLSKDDVLGYVDKNMEKYLQSIKG